MKCNLCLQDTELIKKSHIIPQFMYKGLFGDKHTIALVKLDEFKIVGHKPTGIYDKHILCKKCDNEIIGSYESYASKILHGGNLSDKQKIKITSVPEEKGVGKISVSNINYKKFKLFLISMLWRGHISKQEFFKNIDLGNNYSEKARKMILNGDPGNETDFESMITLYKSNFLPAKSLVPARKIRMENSICYLIHIQGISILYKVSDGYKLEYFENAKMRENDTAQFYTLGGESAKSFFEKLTGAIFP